MTVLMMIFLSFFFNFVEFEKKGFVPSEILIEIPWTHYLAKRGRGMASGNGPQILGNKQNNPHTCWTML